MERVSFVVEQAGCDSCAARIRAALTDVARVEAIEVDEEADTAFVRLSADDISQVRISAVLESASGSGHIYRVREGSWGG